MGTTLQRLARSPDAAGAARMLLLHVAEGVLLWLLLRVDPVSLTVLLAVVFVRVPWPRASSTVPRRFYVLSTVF